MKPIVDDQRLPPDVDAQPLVQAAAALQSVIRGHREEIEREQRLPKTVVEQLHAAGCYRLVIPCELGGLQVDPLTYLRVVELLSEGHGSVGWNVANNSIGQLVTLGLPDEGVHEIYGRAADTVIAGTAVQGGGQATPVDGGYRVSGRWRFGSGCQEASWMLGSFQILDGDQPRRSPDECAPILHLGGAVSCFKIPSVLAELRSVPYWEAPTERCTADRACVQSFSRAAVAMAQSHASALS